MSIEERFAELEVRNAKLGEQLRRVLRVLTLRAADPPRISPATPETQTEATGEAAASAKSEPAPQLSELEQVQRDFAWLRSRRDHYSSRYGL